MIATFMALAMAADQPTLRSGLEPLGFLVGHCWRGELPGGHDQDTHCFEAVYGGQHVRDRHEVIGSKGTYRGETLYSWDATAGAVSYTYWDSTGGVSRGIMRPAVDRLDFGDDRYRGPNGREIRMSTAWRRVAGDAYEANTASSDEPSMNRTVRYTLVSNGSPVATTDR